MKGQVDAARRLRQDIKIAAVAGIVSLEFAIVFVSRVFIFLLIYFCQYGVKFVWKTAKQY